MVGSVSAALGSAGYSWSIAGKDRDQDGKVTREEFKLPVEPGTTTLVPADLRAAGSLDDAFNAYDTNRDGVIDASEAKATPAPAWNSVADRFTPNWGVGMTSAQRDAYQASVEVDNTSLLNQWGLNIQA